MEPGKMKACCPVCGRNLFKGNAESRIEIYCPKCSSLLQINILADEIMVTVETPENKNSKRKENISI